MTLLKAGNEARQPETYNPANSSQCASPTVGHARPNRRFVMAINEIPTTPGIPHTLSPATVARAATKIAPSLVISDGGFHSARSYWSSHLDGAVSELVVPSSTAHRNPQAIAEVKRILKKYAN